VTFEPKSITLALDRQISGASFDELTILLIFWFGEGSHFVMAFCILGLPLLSLEVFFLPLAFWSCLFLSLEVFFLAPCILGLPLFLSDVFFLSPLRFAIAYFFIGCLFS
jgi:hypothetical protein